METIIMDWVKNSLYDYLGMKICEKTSNQIKAIWNFIKVRFQKHNRGLHIENLEEDPQNDIFREDFENSLKDFLLNDADFSDKLIKRIQKVKKNLNDNIFVDNSIIGKQNISMNTNIITKS